jgi:hypothetical protein
MRPRWDRVLPLAACVFVWLLVVGLAIWLRR